MTSTETGSSWCCAGKRCIPNDVWQADHTELDVQVVDESGEAVRPWLTVILDDHSRAVAGYTVFRIAVGIR